ncbi:MAG: acylphosphatase, partial [Minisyncoccales bacterium]
RSFVDRHARELGINGFVRNLSDGNVEVIAQGNEYKLGELVSLCKKGPMAARVDDVNTKSKDLSEAEKIYEDFSIKF